MDLSDGTAKTEFRGVSVQGSLSTNSMEPSLYVPEPFPKWGVTKEELWNRISRLESHLVMVRNDAWTAHDLSRRLARVVDSQDRRITDLLSMIQLHLREQHKSEAVRVPEKVTRVPEHLEIQPLAEAVQATVEKLKTAGKK